VDYLGRVDHQVKIRGFRIELGEIEACLREQETLREAVVVAQDGRPASNWWVMWWPWTRRWPPIRLPRPVLARPCAGP